MAGLTPRAGVPLALAALALAALAGAAAAAPAPGGPGPIVHARDLAPVKQLQQRAMFLRMQARAQRWRAAARPGGARAPGPAARPPREERDPWLLARKPVAPITESPRPAGEALAPNVRANDPALDLHPATTGQSEPGMAAWAEYVLVAWNDGDGFVRPAPDNDVQGYAYSVDGGLTFVDGGIPPAKPGWRWLTDPVIAVNEKTGEFWYCAIFDSAGVANGIGVVRATFAGPAIAWGPPVTVRIQPYTAGFGVDKQWIAADSTSGWLYVAYTNFLTTFSGYSTQTEFTRSPDGASWTPPAKLSAPAADGLAMPSARPVVGPDGAVDVVWAELGPVDVDFFRLRRSIDHGATFGPEATLPSYYSNFGSGAPGFNRERGITTPAIAADRSSGTYRGSIYVAWNECVNFYPDLEGGTGNRSEVEPDNTPATATPFVPGNTLRGTLASSVDADYFSFPGLQGQTVVCIVDSLPGAMDVNFRLLGTDGAVQLAVSSLGQGLGGIIVFTLPVSGTYYLRVTDWLGVSGRYRVRTKLHVPGTGGGRARDHRDVFVSASGDGGASWSAPTRVNQDPPWFDDWLPEISVDARLGRTRVAWYDWRASPPAACGSWSDIMMAFSDDEAASWSEQGPVTDARTHWSDVASNLAPNQGDYLALFADTSVVYVAWSDGRAGNPDIYAAAIPFAPVGLRVTLLSAEATADSVSLEWRVTGSADPAATVQRAAAGGTAWQTLGESTIGPGGVVAWTDRTVLPGQSYDYRIGLEVDGIEEYFALVNVTVPGSLAFALAGAIPNPAVGTGPTVSFTLPLTAPGRLALFDVSGRLVRSVALDGFTPGPHTVDLGEPGMPSGLYFVLLEQGGQRATARVSVVR